MCYTYVKALLGAIMFAKSKVTIEPSETEMRAEEKPVRSGGGSGKKIGANLFDFFRGGGGNKEPPKDPTSGSLSPSGGHRPHKLVIILGTAVLVIFLVWYVYKTYEAVTFNGYPMWR